MVSIELQEPKISMIDYPVWSAVLEWRNAEGSTIGNCVLREHLPPRIEVESPTTEVEEDEQVEPEQEAYENGLDPELDYPAIESECVSTEEEEDARLPDVQGDVVEVQSEPIPQQSEFNFIKVECT